MSSLPRFTDIGLNKVSITYINMTIFKELNNLNVLQFYPGSGVSISSAQTEKVFGNRKPTLVVKDLAQALWGSETLAERIVGGKVTPKDCRNPCSSARKELTPTKVGLLVGRYNFLLKTASGVLQ